MAIQIPIRTKAPPRNLDVYAIRMQARGIGYTQGSFAEAIGVSVRAELGAAAPQAHRAGEGALGGDCSRSGRFRERDTSEHLGRLLPRETPQHISLIRRFSRNVCRAGNAEHDRSFYIGSGNNLDVRRSPGPNEALHEVHTILRPEIRHHSRPETSAHMHVDPRQSFLVLEEFCYRGSADTVLRASVRQPSTPNLVV
jgi:hypothetical protein